MDVEALAKAEVKRRVIAYMTSSEMAAPLQADVKALVKAEIKRRLKAEVKRRIIAYVASSGMAVPLLVAVVVLVLVMMLLTFALFVPLAMFVSETPSALDGGYYEGGIPQGPVPGYTPGEIAFRDVDESALLGWLAARDSALAEPSRVASIVRAARRYDIDPRLLVAITGQEQAFVPRRNRLAERIAANPWNVFGGWYKYPNPSSWAANPSADAWIEKSAAWAAHTVARLSRGCPQGMNVFQWINGCVGEGSSWRKINPAGVYATHSGWYVGVSRYYSELREAL